MENYKSNSHRSKEGKTAVPAEKKVEKVVKGTAKVKKKSEVRKFADIFIAEDVSNVKDYIVQEVIVPLVQKTICDIFSDIPNMIFYGRNGMKKRSGSSNYVSYRDYSSRSRNDEPIRNSGALDFGEVIVESRAEAEEILTRLDELIETYGVVSVADLYDLAGLSLSGRYTYNNYGWTNISRSEVIRVRDGWLVKMPKALPIG